MLLNTTNQADILEVISDLSNDEVFTPPKIANAVLDLLPADVWSDPDLRWLDPATKTGVFLREITRRLMVGLCDAIPDEQARLEHILRDMVFGVAITELTSLMSRRTLYCSKDASGSHSAVEMPTPSGHVWFRRVEHSYVNDRCSECGAVRAQMERANRDNYAYAFIHTTGRAAIEEEFDMKFDVVVGNPPYQSDDAGHGASATTLYHRFVEAAFDLDPRYVAMITPSRWFAGGKGLDQFRDLMLTDGRVRRLVDYPNASEVFPGVDIKGGVSFFLWDRDNAGPCEVTHIRAGTRRGPTPRDLAEFDVFVRDSRGLEVLRRVMADGAPSFAEVVSPRWPFGTVLTSNFKGYTRTRKPNSLKLYMQQAAQKGEIWVDPSVVTRSQELIDRWKVLMPKAGPGNSGGHVLPDMVLGRPIIAAPGSVCSLTYLVVGPFDSEAACASVTSYLRTRFLRFLVALRKPSQDAARGVYRWVPQQQWDREWTDEALYAKYAITKDEQAFIEETVREMAP